jgi:hypothetical protein
MRQGNCLYYNVYPVGRAVWYDPVFARGDICLQGASVQLLSGKVYYDPTIIIHCIL